MRPTARVRGAFLAAVISCLFVPASASAFSKAIWGTPGVVNGVNQFQMYQSLGVKIDETDLFWNEVAPTRPRNPTNPNDPAYHWPAIVSQAITQGKQYGIQVLLQVRDAPAWANGGHTNPAYAPRNPKDYANFMTAAAKHYKAVKLWMVWGEPTRLGNWLPLVKAVPGEPLDAQQKAAPHLYARVLDAAYGALKAVRKSNLVIGGNTYTSGQQEPLQWIQNLKLPNGKAPRMDMYGHNPFSYTTPTFNQPVSSFDQVQFSDLHELAGWINQYLGKKVGIFLSEFTIPTAVDQEFDFSVEPATAAQWVTDVLKESRAWSRIYGLGWVNVYDSTPDAPGDPPRTAGGLLTDTGQPKPDYYAFKNG